VEGSSLAEKLALLIHSTLGHLDSASGRPGAFAEGIEGWIKVCRPVAVCVKHG
jgi:hypothetical protein